MAPVKRMTGAEICAMYAATEADRVRCEAKWLVDTFKPEKWDEYVQGVEAKRGDKSAQELRLALMTELDRRKK